MPPTNGKPLGLLVPAKTEPLAYQRMREGQALRDRLEREVKELKEGKIKKVSNW